MQDGGEGEASKKKNPDDTAAADHEREGDDCDELVEDEVVQSLLKPLIPLATMHQVHSDDPDDRALIPPGVRVNAGWIKKLERSLEALLWEINTAMTSEAEKHCVYVADAAAARLKSDKVVMIGAPEGLNLLYCGPISTTPSANSKKLATLPNLIEFHVHPPAGPPSTDIIVPAWMAKPTAKKDQVTLKSMVSEMKVFIDGKGSVFIDDPQHQWDMCLHAESLDQAVTQLQKDLEDCEESRKAYKAMAKAARAEVKELLQQQSAGAGIGDGHMHQGQPHEHNIKLNDQDSQEHPESEHEREHSSDGVQKTENADTVKENEVDSVDHKSEKETEMTQIEQTFEGENQAQTIDGTARGSVGDGDDAAANNANAKSAGDEEPQPPNNPVPVNRYPECWQKWQLKKKYTGIPSVLALDLTLHMCLGMMRTVWND